jgi:hypothetical protein
MANKRDTASSNNGKKNSNITLLSRADILGKEDMTYDYVECPEWGGTVRVRGLLATERDAYESSIVIGAGTEAQRLNLIGARSRMVAKCCVDENGNRLFTDEDVDALGNKNSAPIDRLFDKIQELSGMTKKAVELQRKNSASAASAVS